jgi:hypothetical protein
MKNSFTLILIFISIACFGQEINWRITKDTFNFSIPGSITSTTVFRNEFYSCFSFKFHKSLFSITFDGELTEEFFIPKKIQDEIYNSLFTIGDALYIKGRYEGKCFAMKRYSSEFESTKCKTPLIFQDSIWSCYKRCYGEWGGLVYFLNNKSQKSFAASANCPFIVNRINTGYFLTNYDGNNSSVIVISAPETLQPTKLNYRKIPKEKHYFGYETMLDTFALRIQTSFVVGEELFHLYSSEGTTFIGKIINGKIESIFNFGFEFDAYFDELLEDKSQILSFNQENSNVKGILIINENQFYFKFIN